MIMYYLRESLSIIIWFAVFLIFFFLELNRKEIFFIYLAIPSLFSGILGFFTKNIEIQIVFFIMSSLVSVIFIKVILDKMIEFNIKFNHKRKYNEDKMCMLLVEQDKKSLLYKVICKSGIYTAKFICDGKSAKKFKIYNIIHDDGKVIIIS